jgi:small subunit ribosomal protein S18
MAIVRRRRIIRRATPIEVSPDFVPSYKDPRGLSHLLTGKGKIVPRSRTSISQKRQKLLAREIKRARHLAMLPFVTVLK